MRTHTIGRLLAGRAQVVGSAIDGPVSSAIAKQACEGARWLSHTGLAGDEQGDRVFHGGPDKALHHYPREHYAWWAAWHPASPVPLDAGAFGENLSTEGITEHEVHVGDVFSAGGALLQVTQARQPCFKLNLRLGRSDAARAMQDGGRTGWYYRVLREGWIAALFPADPAAPGLAAEWERAAALPQLAERWRNAFVRRLASGAIEDWQARLQGPAGLCPSRPAPAPQPPSAITAGRAGSREKE